MNKQLTFGIILQYAQMFLSALISLLYTPIMLRILGASEYGLYNLSSSVISYLSLLSFGLGSSYLKFYFTEKKRNPESIPGLNALYLLTFSIIASIALIAGLVLSFNVNIFLNSTYTNTDRETAKILFIFLTINLAFTFVSSVFVSYVTSQERFIFLRIVGLGKTVFSPLVSIVALFLGYGSIGLVFITTLVSFLVDTLIIIFCIFKLKMRFSFRSMRFKMLGPIFVFSSFIAINSVVDQINWQTDKVILGKMIGSVAVAIYGIGSTINGLYISIGAAVATVFSPKVNAIVARNQIDRDEELTRLMTRVGQIQFIILGLILSGFIIFGKFFIKLWAGEDYYLSYYVTILLILPVTISLIQHLGIEIQRAKNQHKFSSIVYLIIALMNVGLSILLCNFFGIIGITFGTTISLIIGQGIVMNIYYHKKMNINMFIFWRGIVSILPSLFIPILIGVMIYFVGINDVYTFVRGVVAYTFIYVLCVYLFFIKPKNLLKIK